LRSVSISFLMIVRQNYITTDLRVGGSNPSGRASSFKSYSSMISPHFIA
jgi:hypothetical protein